MVYFQTDYLQVEYHSSSDVLITQWYGGCSSLQYRQALIQIARITRELQSPYAVLDRRLQQPLSEDDLSWSFNIYAKAYSRLPLMRLAVVSAFNPKTETQQQHLYNQYKSRFETRTFTDLTSAYDWITSVPAK